MNIRHRRPGFDLNVAFDGAAGVTALFGRSGAGKTTVINAVAGLLSPQSGRISLGDDALFDREGGVNLPPHKRRLGYVFQDGRLFPHLTVRQNLTYGLRFARRKKPGPAFDDVVDLLGLAALLDRRPGGLSGGEVQRVAIGRALLPAPRMLLMDEPLASLDAARRAEILPYLERLQAATDLPILYVSHAIAEVARLASTVVVLEAGKVARAGPADNVLSDPETVRQIGLREAGAILPATVLEHHADGLTSLRISGGTLLLPQLSGQPGSRIRIRVLAQDVILARQAPEGLSALNILPVTILALRSGEGPGMIVQLECGTDRLLARITRRSADALALRQGDSAFAVIKSVSIAQVDVGRAAVIDPSG